MFAEKSSGHAPYWGLEVYVIIAYVKTTFLALGQIRGSCVIDPDSFPRENSTTFTTVLSAWHLLPLERPWLAASPHLILSLNVASLGALSGLPVRSGFPCPTQGTVHLSIILYFFLVFLTV